MTTTPYAPIEPSAKERISIIQANTTPLELKAQAFDFQTHTTTSPMKPWPPMLPPPAQNLPPPPPKKRRITNPQVLSHPQVSQTVRPRTPSSFPHPFHTGFKTPPSGTSSHWRAIPLADHHPLGTTTSKTPSSTSTPAVWNLPARGGHLLHTMGQV